MTKLSNVVDDVVKKVVYDKLVTKVKTFDEVDKKIPDTSGLVKKQTITQKLLRWKKKYLVLLV